MKQHNNLLTGSLLLLITLFFFSCGDSTMNSYQSSENKTDDLTVPCTVPVTIFTQYQETPSGWDPVIEVGAFVDIKNPSGTIIYRGIVPESGYLYTVLSCNSQSGWYLVTGKQVVNNQIIHYGTKQFYFSGFETDIFVRLITYPF